MDPASSSAKDISDILKQVGILSNNWYYNQKFAFCYINGILTLIE